MDHHPLINRSVLPKRSSAAESFTPPHRWYCFWLVAVLFRLMAAAWSWCCIPLSIFLLPYLPPKMTGTSPPNVFRLGRISLPTPPPPASADLRLVVVSIDKMAATQDLCSALPQFFDVCHWGAPSPNQGIPPQRARSRAPTAEATAWRRRRLEQMRS